MGFDMDTKEKIQKYNEIGIDYVEGLSFAADDEEFYEELLNDFVVEWPKRREEIEKLYSNIVDNTGNDSCNNDEKENTWREYTSKVHGMKGVLWALGAQKPGDNFFTLEKLSKARDLEGIQEICEDIIKRTEELASSVSSILQ